MFGKKDTEDVDPQEVEKIKDRLEPGENVLMAVRQSRMRPGGTMTGLTPNTMFVTDRRLLVRNPKMLGLSEDIEDYPYDQITSVKLVKGVMSSAIRFTMPGMTELSKSHSMFGFGGGDDTGTIEAIPKGKAEKMFEMIRSKVQEAKSSKSQHAVIQQRQNPLDLLKTKFVNGEITAEEYEAKRKILEG